MHLGRPKGRAVTIAPKCQGLRKRRWFTTKFIDYMKNESAYSRAIFETAQPSFPEAFAIITAYNPDGIDHAVEENEAFNRLLQREITKRHHSSCSSFEITGKSVCGSHKEPGWGLSCSLEEAIDLGRLFRQEAIFWINTDKSLHLVDVKTREQTCIGKFDPL